MQDSEYIAQVLTGDLEAFGKLIERYQRQLYYFVVGKVAEPEEAQDIVQKSFVTAHESLRRFLVTADFFAWLKGIALNHCRNEWRRHRSQATMKSRLLEARRAELELLRLEEREQQGDTRIVALRHCLQQLTPPEQRLIEHRFVQELPMEEIGRLVQRSGEAVRLWLYRLRTRLADCVRRRMYLREDFDPA